MEEAGVPMNGWMNGLSLERFRQDPRHHTPFTQKPETTKRSLRRTLVGVVYKVSDTQHKENTFQYSMDRESVILDAKRRQRGNLRAEMNHRRSHPKDASHDDLERAFWRFHRCVTRGRTALLNLSTFLEMMGEDPSTCEDLVCLQGCQEEAIIEKTKLDDILFSKQKRGSLKAFKRSMAIAIEEGKAPTWISEVTKEGKAPTWISEVTKGDILNHGGEDNRLYQLLMEGKTACSLMVDARTLEKASQRADLFSETQRSNLLKQSKEIEDRTDQELQRLVEEWSGIANGVPSRTICLRICVVRARCPTRTRTRRNRLLRLPKRVNPKTESLHICSPAVKPIQRTRKGGGYPIWIRKADVKEFIGPGGANAIALKQKSGVSFISAVQNQIDTKDMCPIQIKGDPGAICRAVGLIEKKFNRIEKQPPEMKMEQLWLKNTDIPRLIGANGLVNKRRMFKLGAKYIYAEQGLVDSKGRCPVRIEGTLETIQIKREFDTWDSDLVYSKAVEEALSKETVWILNDDVPELIGPCGTNIKALIRMTGAKSTTAWQDRVDSEGFCPIVIQGPAKSVDSAADEIRNMYRSRVSIVHNRAFRDNNCGPYSRTKPRRIYYRTNCCGPYFCWLCSIPRHETPIKFY
eukprot:scaffold96_cov172-Amphora_coffeaeformis.AAC.5